MLVYWPYFKIIFFLKNVVFFIIENYVFFILFYFLLFGGLAAQPSLGWAGLGSQPSSGWAGFQPTSGMGCQPATGLGSWPAYYAIGFRPIHSWTGLTVLDGLEAQLFLDWTRLKLADWAPVHVGWKPIKTEHMGRAKRPAHFPQPKPACTAGRESRPAACSDQGRRQMNSNFWTLTRGVPVSTVG